MHTKQLFDNLHICKRCSRPLPIKYEGDLCPICEEQELFEKVKEYIRAHDINEYQLAEEFDIPVSKVKAWIRDGRIEYKEVGEGVYVGNFCMNCGTPIAFGTLCSKCKRLENRSGTSVNVPHGESGKMRFGFDK
ncbi:MAG: hypothetical protein K6G40_00050 [Eubacterium sp.]|nr:hypothetical protein [Eubacterium sp.]